MKKIIFIIIIIFILSTLNAYNFREELGISASQERHILGCGCFNLTAMYFTGNPLLSASMGLVANTGMEFYDHSETKKWDYEDLRTGAYCFVGNILINYCLIIIKKQSKEDHRQKSYDPMLRNDPSKATIINLTTLSMKKRVDARKGDE